MAKKAQVPLKYLLRIEEGQCYWPAYLARLEIVLDKALAEKEIFNEKSQENISNVNNTFNKRTKYSIDTSDIDLNIYFPNLSRGEERMLFGYSKQDRAEQKNIIYPKIKFRPKDKNTDTDERLSAILEFEKTISYPEKKKRYSNKNFIPNYNPMACEWFEKFDKINNTQGFYATAKGEYYIKELGYFPDYFNPELKLIMEWDELHHYTKDGELSAKDKKRQKTIQDYFPDFKFIRINEQDVKEYLDL